MTREEAIRRATNNAKMYGTEWNVAVDDENKQLWIYTSGTYTPAAEHPVIFTTQQDEDVV